jgi:hypothetical protein
MIKIPGFITVHSYTEIIVKMLRVFSVGIIDGKDS